MASYRFGGLSRLRNPVIIHMNECGQLLIAPQISITSYTSGKNTKKKLYPTIRNFYDSIMAASKIRNCNWVD